MTLYSMTEDGPRWNTYKNLKTREIPMAVNIVVLGKKVHTKKILIAHEFVMRHTLVKIATYRIFEKRKDCSIE